MLQSDVHFDAACCCWDMVVVSHNTTVGCPVSCQSADSCSHLDGHAGAVEALREEHMLPDQLVVCACKHQLQVKQRIN